jgi:hypothetical protein
METGMTETKIRVERSAVVLHTRPALEMGEEQFFEFCQLNKDRRIEHSRLRRGSEPLRKHFSWSAWFFARSRMRDSR